MTIPQSRAQMDNLGIKPYTTRVKRWRANRLAQAYPRYDARVLMLYSETSKMVPGADDH